MYYEVKVYTLKLVEKSVIKGSVFYYKACKRWVKIATWRYTVKNKAVKDIIAFLSQDKEGEENPYKYTICMKKGGAKRVKR